MEIKIRKLSKYYECDIVDGATTLHFGLLDDGECETLATQFRDAADALFPLPEQPN